MMRYLPCLALTLAVAVSASAQEKMSATEKVAKRLEELLQPGKSITARDSGPVAWPGARSVEQPQIPPAVFKGLPPAPTVASAAKPAGPRPPAEAQPPLAQGPMPTQADLPTKPLVKLPSVDVETPLPIPYLGTPKSDRASLDDTTLEASQAAALQRVRPRRMEQLPFAPLNLPDPFEFVRTGALRNPPAESDQPPAVPVRTPAR